LSDFDFDLTPTASTAGDPDYQTARQLSSPLVYARRVARREFVSGLKRQALTELIPTLPPTDVDLYVVGNGAGAETKHGVNLQAFDFGSFIPHIVDMLGGKACVAYISTWTMNAQHAKSMIDMLDDGRLARLAVVTDTYFKTRESAMCNRLIDGVQRHAPRARFLAFKNHVKCIAIADSTGDRTCVITGSANLSAQPRCEQYVITSSPDVYAFFVTAFFERMFDGGAETVHKR